MLDSGVENDHVGARFSYMSDNILFLSMDRKDRPTRSLTIVKARATTHDLATNEIEINEKGLRLR